MARRLLIGVATIAAMLWILTLGLLIRSYFSLDMLSKTTAAHRHIELLTIPGQLRFTIVQNWPTGREAWQYGSRIPSGQFVIFGQRPIYHYWYFLGIGATSGSARVADQNGNPAIVSFRTVALPLELPLLVLSIAPAWLVWRARGRRLLHKHRAAHGLCLACGYDLRASPDRCPECGCVPANVKT